MAQKHASTLPLLSHLTLQCSSRSFEFASTSVKNSGTGQCLCDDDTLKELISLVIVFITSAFSSGRVEHRAD